MAKYITSTIFSKKKSVEVLKFSYAVAGINKILTDKKGVYGRQFCGLVGQPTSRN
jgi:hypothetical protein